MDYSRWMLKMDASSCWLTRDFRVCTDGNAELGVGVVMKSQVKICDIFNAIQQYLKIK